MNVVTLSKISGHMGEDAIGTINNIRLGTVNHVVLYGNKFLFRLVTISE